MWPKKLPELTEEQKRIREDFMVKWHQELASRKKYRLMENFDHVWGIKKDVLPVNCKTLEIGAGLGAHIAFENLQKQDYYALELRKIMADQVMKRFPAVKVIIGDIQKKTNFPDEYFNRIIIVHVLEHLLDLPSALNEIKRMLRKDGFCDFVVPCEGGVLYSVARKISAERLFKKNYKISYDWFVKSEHVSTYNEIMEELGKIKFKITWKRFFPFFIPSYSFNLAVGLRGSFER